jgi:hypothetical protein
MAKLDKNNFITIDLTIYIILSLSLLEDPIIMDHIKAKS